MMRCAVSLIVLLGFAHLHLTTSRSQCMARLNNLTLKNSSYINNLIEDIITSLKWRRVIVIYNTVKATFVDIDSTVRMLHERRLSTLLIDHSITRDSSNMTSLESMLNKVIDNNTSSSETTNFLILGDYQFVLQMFRKISKLFLETPNTVPSSASDNNQRHLSALRTEGATLVNVMDQHLLNDALTNWEHVIVIDTSQLNITPVWTLQRSKDSTQLRYVTSMGTPAPLNRHRLLPIRSQGLSGRTLRVVVDRPAGFFMMKKVHNGRQMYYGVVIDMLDELSQRLNFSYIIKETSDNSTGVLDNNGQWNGVIGMLTRQEADIAAGAFRLDPDRLAVVDATSPFLFEDMVLILKTPQGNSDGDDFFLRPFSYAVYGVVAGCAVLVLLLLLLSRFCEWHTHTHEGTKPDVMQWLMADMEIILAGLLNRSHDINFSSRAYRVAAVTWFFVGSVVIASVYSSQLTATLTIRDFKLPFTSLEGLVNQDTYTWGVSSGIAIESILKVSKKKVYRKVYRRLMQFAETDPDVRSRSFDVQYQKVLTGHYVFLCNTDIVLKEWQSYSCDIIGIHVREFYKPTVFYLQKHSPYTQMVSDVISHMVEKGLLTYLLRKWTPKKKTCRPRDMTSAINMERAKTAFYVIGVGIGLSLISLILEFWVVWVRRRLSCANQPSNRPEDTGFDQSLSVVERSLRHNSAVDEQRAEFRSGEDTEQKKIQ